MPDADDDAGIGLQVEVPGTLQALVFGSAEVDRFRPLDCKQLFDGFNDFSGEYISSLGLI